MINTILITILITSLPLFFSILNINNKLNTNIIINLIITLITSFPLFLSTLNSIIKFINNKSKNISFLYPLTLLLDLVIYILDKIQIEPDKQLDTLFFTNIIASIQAIIFFINTYYFKDLFKTFSMNKKIDINYKVFLLVQNIIITIIIFLLNPDLDNYII